MLNSNTTNNVVLSSQSKYAPKLLQIKPATLPDPKKRNQSVQEGHETVNTVKALNEAFPNI